MTGESVSITETTVADKKNISKEYKFQILYLNVAKFILLHVVFIYGLYLGCTSSKYSTNFFATIFGFISGLGITAGAHRLWCHRTYKAKLPLRIFLCICNCTASQDHIYSWTRDHRVHHKFSETDADPHNIKNGFFFAHMGWLMYKKHPQVTEKGKTVCLDDLLADPVVLFQKRFYIPLAVLFSAIVPTMIPVLLWKETLWNSFLICAIVRIVFTLHFTWLVNSAAHMYGDKPFDKHIHASENIIVSFFSMGEGWHNYHHVFPWDYAVSELGNKMNATKMFIDLMAKIGQAYDLKTANTDAIKNVKLKRGDGSR